MQIKARLRRLQCREELLTLRNTRNNTEEVMPVGDCRGNGCEQLVCALKLMYNCEEMKEIGENNYYQIE